MVTCTNRYNTWGRNFMGLVVYWAREIYWSHALFSRLHRVIDSLLLDSFSDSNVVIFSLRLVLIFFKVVFCSSLVILSFRYLISSFKSIWLLICVFCGGLSPESWLEAQWPLAPISWVKWELFYIYSYILLSSSQSVALTSTSVVLLSSSTESWLWLNLKVANHTGNNRFDCMPIAQYCLWLRVHHCHCSPPSALIQTNNSDVTFNFVASSCWFQSMPAPRKRMAYT